MPPIWQRLCVSPAHSGSLVRNRHVCKLYVSPLSTHHVVRLSPRIHDARKTYEGGIDRTPIITNAQLVVLPWSSKRSGVAESEIDEEQDERWEVHLGVNEW